MIYKLDRAKYSTMRITKKEEGTVIKQKYYSGATCRLTVAGSKRIKGAYETGLTEAQETEMEIKLGLDKGTLAKKSPYWTEFGIRVESGGITLNDEFPEDELKVLILKSRADVATSSKEVDTKKGVEWLLHTEEAEAEVNVKEFSSKIKAYSKYASMELEDMKNYLKALNVNINGMSEKVIRGRVGLDVDKTPKKFLLVAEDKNQNSRIFINELVSYGIVKMNKASYVSDEDIPMANSMEEMIAFVADKSNAKTIITWKKQLEEAKK